MGGRKSTVKGRALCWPSGNRSNRGTKWIRPRAIKQSRAGGEVRGGSLIKLSDVEEEKKREGGSFRGALRVSTQTLAERAEKRRPSTYAHTHGGLHQPPSRQSGRERSTCEIDQ